MDSFITAFLWFGRGTNVGGVIARSMRRSNLVKYIEYSQDCHAPLAMTLSIYIAYRRGDHRVKSMIVYTGVR